MLKRIFAPILMSSLFLTGLYFTVLRSNIRDVRASVSGTTINVDINTDVIANDGHCSLREAIIAANMDSSSGQAAGECPPGLGADIINIPAGTYTLTLPSGVSDTPSTGDLDITSQVTILGASGGTTKLDANHIDRALEISATAKANISNLWVQGGYENGYGGGGLKNHGQLSLDHVLIIANFSSSTGGGLSNEGEATLSYVSFGNNGTSLGGCIINYGTITITHTALDFGNAINGGGLANEGSAILRDVNISANTAITDGAGIYNTGIITLTRVTVNDNTASNRNGGGIWSNGIINLENTTLSANSANGLGGGFFLQEGGGGIMTNATIADNTAGLGGGIYALVSGLSIKNSLLANNTGGNCRENGTLNSLGYNMSDDLTCNYGLNQSGDQNNVSDVKIGPLANNGGSTETHALLPGSPAIDAGDNNGCPSVDQRGYKRPVDGDLDGMAACDIGAYERWLEIYLPLVMR